MTFESPAVEIWRQPPRTSGKWSILVVEDDPDAAALVSFVLEGQGLLTTNVPDGEAALAVMERDPPALVILDLMLPGISGIEFCRRIRREARTAGLPIVMLSGRAAEEDRMLGLKAGADDYITKPFSPRELVSRVGVVLRRSAEQETVGATLQP
jgi:two-component system phosphate regulon response regulator PhoB